MTQYHLPETECILIPKRFQLMREIDRVKEIYMEQLDMWWNNGTSKEQKTWPHIYQKAQQLGRRTIKTIRRFGNKDN